MQMLCGVLSQKLLAQWRSRVRCRACSVCHGARGRVCAGGRSYAHRRAEEKGGTIMPQRTLRNERRAHHVCWFSSVNDVRCALHTSLGITISGDNSSQSDQTATYFS